ncbi:LPS assembly lipoprotein LptE [Parabacteroides sp. Marseille-P3160]|uniref:LPS assembly lipoprotein LptE n=1 Tax=Parabacteroides sp. Marseille-P3160 TaxID=1917887 RepID=UPI00350F6FB2
MNRIGIILLLLVLSVTACKISYTPNAATIDYTKVHTISIKDFPNMAPLVYPPLSQMLTQSVQDAYINKTRLSMTRDNGDLDIEGEIIGYDQMQHAVKDNEQGTAAYASQTRLTLSVRVRYANRANPEQGFEQTFSAYRDFSNSNTLQQVQDELCTELVKEIVDQIYNATVANW